MKLQVITENGEIVGEIEEVETYNLGRDTWDRADLVNEINEILDKYRE